MCGSTSGTSGSLVLMVLPISIRPYQYLFILELTKDAQTKLINLLVIDNINNWG